MHISKYLNSLESWKKSLKLDCLIHTDVTWTGNLTLYAAMLIVQSCSEDDY